MCLSPSSCIALWVFHSLHSLLFAWISTCLYLCLCFIAAYCSPPSYPVNGSVHSLTGTKLGSTLRFSCDQGFRLIGQSSATCTKTPQGIHQWNAPVPLCQGKSSTFAVVSWVRLRRGSFYFLVSFRQICQIILFKIINYLTFCTIFCVRCDIIEQLVSLPTSDETEHRTVLKRFDA